MVTYSDECKLGRQAAARAIEDCRATDNVPRLIKQVREMAADESGVGVGYLYTLIQSCVARQQ
jgi:hypothetical protein